MNVHDLADRNAEAHGERAMRFLLIALIALIATADLFNIRMSLGRGLSAENALLYVLCVGLVFKLVAQQPFVFQLRALHACFIVLIVYGVCSVLAAKFLVAYPRYSLIASGISLKSRLVDQVTYFLVFFYGLRESRNAHAVLRVLFMAVGVGGSIAVLNALGIVQIGDVGESDTGRVESIMGEPNQDAAFLALFLPGLLAVMLRSSGVWILIWGTALCASIVAFVLTASRGGLVAIVLASIWGSFLLRRSLPLSRIIPFVITGTALIALLVVGLSLRFGDLLYTRLITDTFSSDMVGGSSGRLEFWSLGLGAMLNAPITLLTGFGWDVWSLMPFPRAPHNQYLNLYFHLGVIGLTCVTALLALLVREARAAIPFAPYTYKSVLMAFVIGLLAFATAAFFVDLYKPWMWCWAYAGLVMRMAVNIRAKASMVRPETKQPSAVLSPKDRFGWTGSAHRCAARRKAATTK